MQILTIQMNRGAGWELRGQGEIPAATTQAEIDAQLARYAIGYPHRALLDGVPVAEVSRPGMRPKVRRLTR